MGKMLEEILNDMARPYRKYLPQVSSAKSGEHSNAELQECRDVFRDVFACLCSQSPLLPWDLSWLWSYELNCDFMSPTGV